MSVTPLQGTKREGTMVRVARWLVTHVGIDGVFTKQDLIEAFPGISQVDRRMRDLRPHGWVIHTYREDGSLAAHERRFVSQGVDVWLKLPRSSRDSITAKERRRALLAADYICGLCGVPAGQTIPSQRNQTAVLSVTREDETFSIRCQVCRSDPAEDAIGKLRERLRDSLSMLEGSDRETFRVWLESGRPPSELDRAWGLALRLGTNEARKLEQSSKD